MDDNNSILNTAFDLAEREIQYRIHDPSEPDALEHAQKLRAQYTPQPRLDTAAERRAEIERSWTAFVDTRIAKAFALDTEMDPNAIVAAFAQGGALSNAFGGVIAELRQKFHAEIQVEVEALQRELMACRREIRALKTKLAAMQKITSWAVDYKTFQATPFYNSAPGTSLDLYPLFAAYHNETS